MIDQEKAVSAVADLLVALGVDADVHTRDTPRRVASAWCEALSGYSEDPARHLKQRFDSPEDAGLIIVAGIRMVSTCAHHLLPIVGSATVAYRPQPDQGLVGLSKVVRVVQGYSRRLQVQERLGYQITRAMLDTLRPVGCACLITARHDCMAVRGVKDSSTTTTTKSILGRWTPEHPDVLSADAEHRSSLDT